MRNVCLIKIFIFILFFTQMVLANTTVICTPAEVKIQNKNLILPGLDEAHGNKIYFIHNISKKSLWIDHPLEGQQSAKAGWSSFFQPDKWSAILINRKDFAINCAIIEPGKVNFQNCSKVISVCVPENPKHALKRKGSYWLAEDKTFEDLLANLEKRGLVFEKVASQEDNAILKNKDLKQKNVNSKANKKTAQPSKNS